MDRLHDPWYLRFPGAGAADNARRMLANVLDLIDKGEHARAQDMLSSHRWRRNIDLNGVPPDVLKKVEGYVDVARDALRHPPEVEAAQRALRLAQQQFGPGDNS